LPIARHRNRHGLAELRSGAEKAGRPKLVELVEAYLDRLAILDWTNEVSGYYARIRSLHQ
jgi:hypothetical protein